MTKEQYEAHLKTPKWRKLRLEVFKRDGYKCLECSTKYNLQAHHLTYDDIGDEKIEQLITLCRKCHEKQHKGELLVRLIRECCKRFLSQRPSEDYNPRRTPRCHGCDYKFEDWKEVRYRYGAFGVYCASCISKVKVLLKKSKAPELVAYIESFSPSDRETVITYLDENDEVRREYL